MNRRMLFLFIVFGMLCLMISASEDSMQTQSILSGGKPAIVSGRASPNDIVYSMEEQQEDEPHTQAAKTGESQVSQTAKADGSTDAQQKNIQQLSAASHTVLTTITDEPTIRVVLSQGHKGNIPSGSITVSWTEDTTVGQKTYSAGTRAFTASDVSEEGLCLTTKGKFSLSFDETKDERDFSGKLYLYARGQEIYAVNEIALEEYVACVVPGEMPAYYPVEALKAQAICARTYGLGHLKSAEEYHADVGDSVAWQVFNGAGRKDKTDKAAEDTKGQVLITDNAPAMLYFYSTSYGFTGKDDVWYDEPQSPCLKSVYLGDNNKKLRTEHDFVSYIRKRDEHALETEETWFRWHTEFTQAQLVALCKQMDETVEEVVSVQVTKRNSSYAAMQLTVDCKEKELTIDGEYDIREFLSPAGVDLTNQSETRSDRKVLPSGYFALDPVYSKGKLEKVKIYGGGLGHGAGMSQNGAKCMAEKGMSYKEILATFFDIS